MNQKPASYFGNCLNSLALIRFLLFFVSGWALVQCLTYFQSIIVIFIFAAILAFLLSYPARLLSSFLPHNFAVSLVFLLSILILLILTITVGVSISSQEHELLESVTTFFSTLKPLVENLEQFLRHRNLHVDLRGIEEPLRNQALAFIGGIISIFQILFTNLITLMLIAVVAFFMLLDGEKLWYFLLRLFPSQIGDRITSIIQRNFLGFFRGQLILCLFLSISSFIVFLILQIPFALILALTIGLLDLIPGIGATLGIGLTGLILLPKSVWLAMQVLIICLILQQIQDNLVTPRVMQNSLNLNPVVVFFALLVGAKIAGLLGIFLAIPSTGVLVSLFELEEMKSVSAAAKELTDHEQI